MVPTNLIVGRECRHALMPFVVPVTTFPPSSISGTNFQGSSRLFQAFSCQTSGLVYGMSCRRCPAICIGETGRTPRQCLDEHLRSIKKNLPGFPVAEHFNAAGHSIDDVLVHGSLLCGATSSGSGWRCAWFQTRHHLSALPEFRLPFPSDPGALYSLDFKLILVPWRIQTFYWFQRTWFSTDEAPSPKSLETLPEIWHFFP